MPHCVHTDETACTRAVHAEANVIASAAKYGVSLQGSEVYVTHSPCLSCAGLLVNAAISKVCYTTEFRDTSGIALLEAAGVTVDNVMPTEYLFPQRFVQGLL
ncbi:deoxycytidylate deaminase [Gordonia phage Lauer]|uniref:Deoxycytidylate deaminase n=1 Tax=Gordonia phage Lauer TaxID=2656538 RepID=A0A649VIE4_9CAUD|nr:dCMP deaminase [Gordonia phage Lauer]QGJ92150.1 deoxycytidylate deaminase [Gordonia phage Lauer]